MLAKWMANNVPVLQCKLCFVLGWRGFATPLFIVVDDKCDTGLVSHEQAHVFQWWHGWIVGFAVLYLLELIVHGYRENGFEVAARMYGSGTIHYVDETWPYWELE